MNNKLYTPCIEILSKGEDLGEAIVLYYPAFFQSLLGDRQHQLKPYAILIVIVSMMPLPTQVAWLFLVAIPVACIAWTVTHEEVFKEPREYCIKQSTDRKTLLGRKFFYLFTCEYCFSHYVTVFILILTGYKFLMDDWRGYLLAGFTIVWVANIYMSLFALIKVDIKKERLITKNEEEQANHKTDRRKK